MITIWVLSCGSYPHSWNEDVHVLLNAISETFPEKLWQQLNQVVWETSDKSWRCTQINKEAGK